jgi:chromosome segregation ATPase
LEGLQSQLEAARKEVEDLQASVAAAVKLRDEARGQLLAERSEEAAARAGESRIAASHRELQEMWKGVADELKESIKVSGAFLKVACCGRWAGYVVMSVRAIRTSRAAGSMERGADG